MRWGWKQPSVIPGFGLTLGYTLLYLSLVVLLPLSALFVRSAALSWEEFWDIITQPRVVASLARAVAVSRCRVRVGMSSGSGWKLGQCSQMLA